MRLDQSPPAHGASLPRSVAACLAAILELPTGEVPVPDGADPWTVWRVWLGTRGLGLVAVAGARGFSRPGAGGAGAGSGRGVRAGGLPRAGAGDRPRRGGPRRRAGRRARVRRAAGA